MPNTRGNRAATDPQKPTHHLAAGSPAPQQSRERIEPSAIHLLRLS